MKLGKCEISGKAIDSKSLCSVGETIKTLSLFSHTQDKFKIPEKKVRKRKKEDVPSSLFSTCGQCWPFFYCWLHLFPIFFHYREFVSVVTTSISSVCPRSCGLFRLPPKCFHLSTSEYLHSFFSLRCDHLLSLSCRFFPPFNSVMGVKLAF